MLTSAGVGELRPPQEAQVAGPRPSGLGVAKAQPGTEVVGVKRFLPVDRVVAGGVVGAAHPDLRARRASTAECRCRRRRPSRRTGGALHAAGRPQRPRPVRSVAGQARGAGRHVCGLRTGWSCPGPPPFTSRAVTRKARPARAEARGRAEAHTAPGLPAHVCSRASGAVSWAPGAPFHTARPGPIVSCLALGAPQGSTRRGDGAVCQETWAPAWSRPCVPTVGRAIAYQAPQDPAQPRDRAVLPLGCRGPREPPGSLTPVLVGLRLGSVCVPPTGPSMD